MTTESEPLVSVVTPVYNTEKYLAQCIESVLAQTYQNWEYVIVNNRSTDRSLEIAEKYAKQDARIRVYDNDQFLDQMPNWNHAMRQMSPDSCYCKVVHADDWLFPDCIRQMVAVAEAYPTVGMVGAYRLDEDKVNLDGLPYPSTYVPGRELCRSYFLGGPYVFGSPTSILLRSDLVRGRKSFYDESIIHADKDVCIELLQNSDFGFVHQVLTFTRRHNESATMFTRRFATYRLEHLAILKKYGPIFLTDDEFEERFKRSLNGYYKFLAKNVLELREGEFWRYHQVQMEKMGYPLSKIRITAAVCKKLLDPREALGIVRQSLRNRKGKEPQLA